jgi:uroporphyrinogen-III synthase
MSELSIQSVIRCFSNETISKLSLGGRTILVTRSSEGNSAERRKLEALGAMVIEVETMKISPPSSWEKLDHIFPILDEIDWIIFTSANGVRFFFERFSTNALTKKSGRMRDNFPKFACVGPSTAEALERAGYVCSFEPSEFLTSTLGEELKALLTTKSKVVLARAEEAGQELGTLLRKAGAEVLEVPVYSIAPRMQELSPRDLDRVTDITLMSPSAVEGLMRSVSSGEIRSRGIRVHCIGPVTSRAAEKFGLAAYSISAVHTLDGLIQTIIDS